MPAAERRTFGLHLAWLLSFAVTNVFVTALAAITGNLVDVWPLYILSIVIAALGYHISGVALSLAVTVASIALLSYATGAGFAAFAEILPGMAAYAVAATVIGIQAQRFQRASSSEPGALYDSATGALSHAVLCDGLGLELKRATRYAWPASAAIVRVTDFAAFRHKFGRIKAEQLLARTYQVLLLNARETDLVGRWGDESFAVILQLADNNEARGVITRLADAIAETPFEGDALEPVTHVTLQSGVATFPEDGADSDELMACALRRMNDAGNLAPPAWDGEDA